MAAAATMTQLPPEQLKFMEEATKRTRPEGSHQFQELHYSDAPRLRRLVDDIFADHAALDKRSLPIQADGSGHAKFLIMGAGIGGIMSAIKLVQAGYKQNDIVLIEIGGGVGGTWYWNRYPGLHCDVEAYCYLPMLEETGFVPSYKYTSAVEIRNYLVQLVEEFGLEDRILYRTQANSLQWDEEKKVWKVNLTMGKGEGGREKSTVWVSADVPILMGGLFPHPHVPKIPGLVGFEGEMFHTSRWDYSITGGSSEETFPTLSELEGKRVGFVGTGATAIQAVPEVAKYAKELYVFQRTPSQVNTRGQRTTDPEEWRERIATGPGWQKARMENLSQHISRNADGEVNLIDDVWSHLKAYCTILGSEKFASLTPEKIPEHIARMQAWDAEHNAKARARVTSLVSDKAIAEKLTPWYPTWCKRPTFSDTYLQTFNKPSVHLVDTDGKGIDSITAHSVITNGVEYPVDVLILSTGYRSPGYGHGDPALRFDVEIVGRNGLRMTDKWSSKGAATLHGVFTHDFPNLFFFGLSQCSATANVNHTLEVQCTHITSLISRFLPPSSDSSNGQEEKVLIEPSVEAEEAWALQCLSGAAFFSSLAVCTPSYVTLEGDAMKPKSQDEMMKAGRGSMWSAGLVPFERVLEKWRKDGFEGVEVSGS